MKVLIFLLVVDLLLAFDDFPEDCQELFEDNIHPKKCCDYPTRKILDAHSELCKNVCKDSKSFPAGCCELDCVYGTSGTIKNGDLVTEAVVQLYENYLTENGGGKYDSWMEVIENSIETCEKAVPKSSDILVCDIPEYVLDFLDCVDSQNFLNCPKFKYSSPCNKTRSIAENENKCGIKTGGIFIVNHRFWTKKEDEEEKN